MSYPAEDATDIFSERETPDIVATKEVIYTIASDEIGFKEEDNEDVLYQYGHQEGIDDPNEQFIKTEKEEQEVDEHLVGDKVLNLDDSNTRLIKHEEERVLLENIVDEPKGEEEEEEEGFEYKYVLQENYDEPSKYQLLKCIKAESSYSQDDSIGGEVKAEDSKTWLITSEGDEEVLLEIIKDEPKVTDESAAVPQTKDTFGWKDTLDECEITSELLSTAEKADSSEETGDIVFVSSDDEEEEDDDDDDNEDDDEDGDEEDADEEKDFKCSVCGLFCASYYMLRKHMSFHKALYPYQCSCCPFVCKQAIELRRHVKKAIRKPRVISDLNVTRSQFQCLFCSYSCTLAINFKRHMETHLKEKSKKLNPYFYSDLGPPKQYV